MKKISIIFEDSDILVLEKPTGLVVNRSNSQVETLADLVEEYLKISNFKLLSKDGFSSKKQISNDFVERAGIVHRIDKDTSGIVLAAKNPVAFEKLQAQFFRREIEKEYLCLCHGFINEDKGKINSLIGRLGSGKFGILEGGREAVTEYQVIQKLKVKSKKFEELLLVFGKRLSAFFKKEARDYTYLRIFPKTGRTHQIRVHLKSISHPIVADPLYLGRRFAKFDAKFCPRLFLHACRIKFFHPADEREIEFTSPLPADLQKVLEQLK